MSQALFWVPRVHQSTKIPAPWIVSSNSERTNLQADTRLTSITGENRRVPNHSSNPLQADIHQRQERDSSQEKTIGTATPLQADKHPTSCMKKYKTPALLLLGAGVPPWTLPWHNSMCQYLSLTPLSLQLSLSGSVLAKLPFARNCLFDFQ